MRVTRDGDWSGYTRSGRSSGPRQPAGTRPHPGRTAQAPGRASRGRNTRDASEGGSGSCQSGALSARQQAINVAGRQSEHATVRQDASNLGEIGRRIVKVLDRIPHAKGINFIRLEGGIEEIAAMHTQIELLHSVPARFARNVAAAHVPIGTGQVEEKAIRAADLEEPSPTRQPAPEPLDSSAEIGFVGRSVGQVIAVLRSAEIVFAVKRGLLVGREAPRIKDQSARPAANQAAAVPGLV